MQEMPQSYRKLKETRFFLDHLIRVSRPNAFNFHHPDHLRLNLAINAGKGVKLSIDDEKFHFYLSAFLSAGRSVTFVLQNECKSIYDQSFPQWRSALSPEDQELLDLMNSQRVREIHNVGAASLKVDKTTEVPARPGDPKTPIAKIILGGWAFEFRGKPQAIKDLCAKYYGLLETLVVTIGR